MQIVAATHRIVRWPIEPVGAARGTWRERTSVLISVRDDAGGTGVGEAAPLPGMSIDDVGDAVRAAGELARRVPLAIDMPGHALAWAARVTDAPAARFAIETALLAVLAQRAGTSIASLLCAVPQGELRHAVVVDDEREARAAVAAGARCLKIKVADHDVARLVRIARAAPGVVLRLDANRAWPRGEAVARLAELRDLPIEYVEEPCVDAHELLDEPLACRIALDESLVGLAPSALARALESPQLAALVLKPTLLGGFARCLELASLAHAHGVAPVVTHALEGPVGTAACTELARAIGADVPVGLAPHPALARFGEARDVEPTATATATATAALSVRAAAHECPDAPALIAEGRTLTFAEAASLVEATAAPFAGAGGPLVVCERDGLAGVLAAWGALAARRPIAMLHPKLADAERTRQRAIATAASYAADDAFVLFTSGSTGQPRGIVHTRTSIAASAAASAARLGWRDDDRWLLCLPLAHTGGLSVAIRCLIARKPVVIDTNIARALRDHAVTLASLVPTQLAALLDDAAWRPPASLRAVLLGGAATPPALLERALARGVPVRLTYGLTETFGQIATATAAGAPPALLPGVSIDAGTPAEPAPIRVRGPMLARTYLDGEAIAPELVTADLGHLDGRALHIAGRRDDVIISGGENVHPLEVEAALAATPGVRSACVFGVADPRWGQVVAAAIATDATFDRARALARWHATLPPHARPRRLAILPALPQLPNGKLDRRAIAACDAPAIDYGTAG